MSSNWKTKMVASVRHRLLNSCIPSDHFTSESVVVSASLGNPSLSFNSQAFYVAKHTKAQKGVPLA
ncbi:hypothetical protein SISNIDRAFT_223274 [Sistotremastrum niveocremeum HHB9708]|uniref:Uncharacterized protein n=1 Tax=Sistotremastrum niveocremeum HHB9708 TaxID=1314777 RepID=A0A164QFZ6_9AGAM|nr:hypothetical protein SISNIDRAFT_223274 [Sistotremastrum niveocremeum HHB9708]